MAQLPPWWRPGHAAMGAASTTPCVAMGAACGKRRRVDGRASAEKADDSCWPWIHALQAQAKAVKGGVAVDLPVEILPHLLLGDKRAARDVERLKDLAVTHVLNVAGEVGANADIDYASRGIRHENLHAEDEEGYPMLAKHLQRARAFIAQARKAGGRCLVHCVAGINRSGVLCAAEVLLGEQVPVLEAVRRCRRARGSNYLSNRTFQIELVLLAAAHGLLGPRPRGFPDEPPEPIKLRPRPMDALDRLVR